MKKLNLFKKILHIIYEVVTWSITIIVLSVGVSAFSEKITGEPDANVIGINITIVQTGSMASVHPVNEDRLKDVRGGLLQVDDVVILRKPNRNEDIKVGTIVTYLHESGYLIIHRVSEKFVMGGKVYYRTRGDANNVSDPIVLTKDDIRGVYLFRIPAAGKIVKYLRSKYGIVAILLIIFIKLFVKLEEEKEKAKQTPLMRY